nr:hypothetical protein [Crocosphaera chwakensis]
MKYILTHADYDKEN